MSKSQLFARIEESKKGNDYLFTRINQHMLRLAKSKIASKIESNLNKYFDDENQKLLKNLFKSIWSLVRPIIVKKICQGVENAVLACFGPGIITFALKAKQIYNAIKELHTAFTDEDFVQRWNSFGSGIGQVVEILTGSPGSVSICRRRKRRLSKMTKK